ncbi:MAG: fatty acid desaturase [Vallitaleaceae bacterium]|nr:fatty acid desaturase [Vallitaleaceae bacterium]
MIEPSKIIEVKEWFKCDLDKKELKKLLARDDSHAWFYVGGWLLLILIFATVAILLYPTVWSIPVFIIYGILISASNARWHECSHGTPFKTDWLNEATFYIATTMEMRDVVSTRWEHALHHSYTIFEGVDQEILLKRPPNLLYACLDFFYLKSGPTLMWNTLQHAFGIVSKNAKLCVPETDFKRMFWWSRATLLPYILAVILAVVIGSWLPILLIVLPRFYGGFLQWIYILLQHGGLAENVWDHRLNCRTVYFNKFNAFLYMEMQYHVEHHMYPMVPFHALRALREQVKDQLPEINKSIFDGLKEMVPALLKQRKDPSYFIRKEVRTTK